MHESDPVVRGQSDLPPIPAKRYFTIGEVSELCGVKPHVLRYWEQEFTQLRPIKRRGNRRYYQHHEVLLIRRIRELLYDLGFTISGARNRLDEATLASRAGTPIDRNAPAPRSRAEQFAEGVAAVKLLGELRGELEAIRRLLVSGSGDGSS
jgi:DNA-binding transcriptional MerR regulator